VGRVPLIAAGVIALLVEPLRQKLQRGAGRLRHAARDDPYVAVRRLALRLEGSVDPFCALFEVTKTVAETLHLPYAAVEIVSAAGPSVVASYGRPQGEPHAFPMSYQGQVVGVLSVTPRSAARAFTAAEQALLEDLAYRAGLVTRTVRQTWDLQRSRERLVRSHEEERRRLRRTLHDGLGSTLAGLTMRVGAVRSLSSTRDPQVDEALGGLEQGLQACVQEIRRMADDLRPRVLEQLGLIQAVRRSTQSYRSPEVVVEGSEEIGEPPAAVEVAAFRIATEAITNAVHHAHAQRCDVRLTLEHGDTLVVEVTDDGIGLPRDYEPGAGITSMRERAEELGGLFLAEPRTGRGTRIRAELPLGP
jgi:signal transduction histidine kinase